LTNALKRGIPVMTIVDARLLHDIEMPLPVGHLIVIIAIDANTIFYHDPEGGGNKMFLALCLSRLGKI
jgi:hypothetical protein